MSDTSNPPSIRDIAEIAGVSVATVSRVLNKKGKYSATTEKRVLAVVNSCGYISNMSAGGPLPHGGAHRAQRDQRFFLAAGLLH